jgi:hypothetical protein
MLHDNTLDWLLEPDTVNPGVRYFALRDLLDQPADAPDVVAAQAAVMASGPVPAILAAQDRAGFWVEPGPGYYPKYTGTVWQITFLAQFGADGRDLHVRAGCDYLLDHSRSTYGGFSAGSSPSGMIHCLQGNLAAALLDLGWLGDPRLAVALDWLARSITGAGVAPAADQGCADPLLPQRQQRVRLCLRRQQPLALRLGRGQGHARAEQGSRRGAHAGSPRRDRRGDRVSPGPRPRAGRLPDALRRQAQPELVPFRLPHRLCHRRAAESGGADGAGTGAKMPVSTLRSNCWKANGTRKDAGSWSTPTTARPGPTSRRRASPASGSRCAHCACCGAPGELPEKPATLTQRRGDAEKRRGDAWLEPALRFLCEP